MGRRNYMEGSESHANGQNIPFKVLNIPHDQGNKNENYFEIQFHSSKKGHHQENKYH